MKFIILTTIFFVLINICFAQNNTKFESKKVTKVAIRERKPSKADNSSNDVNVLVKAPKKIINIELKKRV